VWRSKGPTHPRNFSQNQQKARPTYISERQTHLFCFLCRNIQGCTFSKILHPSSFLRLLGLLFCANQNAAEKSIWQLFPRIILFSYLYSTCFPQEHVVRMVVKLLSPPLPSDSSTQGSMSHYLSQKSTLNAILLCVSYVDAVHILSLYGMVRYALSA
jgi:hypothetical protein